MAAFTDHLWQSTLFATLIALLAWLVRANAPALRLWLWRIAALKYLVPFSLLFHLGEWLGFPVRHSAIPPPPALSEAVASASQWTSPMQVFAPSGMQSIGALLLLLGVTILCVRAIAHQQSIASRHHNAELARVDADGDYESPRLGMFKATTLAAAAFSCLTAPMLAGAVHDRHRRQQALAVDIRELRKATITLAETPSRFGAKSEVIAGRDGVLIRHINLQELVALVYGIGQFEVFGGALPWLSSPHYDVKVSGPVSAPAVFDPYSLRQPVTDYLFHEYGVSIRINGSCQEPCLNQDSFVVERIPWRLPKMISGQN